MKHIIKHTKPQNTTCLYSVSQLGMPPGSGVENSRPAHSHYMFGLIDSSWIELLQLTVTIVLNCLMRVTEAYSRENMDQVML